jgi:hypothetical protein
MQNYPIVTLSMNNWSKPPRYHLNDYFYNTGNQFDQGFITRSVTEIRRNYQRIQGFVEEMGWQ